MKLTLTRQNQAVHFEARNEQGATVQIDGSPDLGGQGLGVRPMEMLAMSLAGCSAIDIVSILKKMKQPLEDLRVEIDAEREPGKDPSLFTTIHLHFVLTGDLDPAKIERALALSIDKYCSVARILDKTAEIRYSYELK